MTCADLIYRGAGSPEMAGAIEGACVACSSDSHGVLFSQWTRPTFVDFDKLRPGEILCHACQFCFEDGNTLLQSKLARDKPQRMRNYSHFAVGNQWIPLSKGEKPRMIELLQSEPAVAIIADSGQKHIIFRARLGWWQFEEQQIRPDKAALVRLIVVMRTLLTAFSKAEIDSGLYPTHRILKFGLKDWRTSEQQIKPQRGSALFSLALFLAQKENDGDRKDSGQPAGSDLERNRPGVQAPLFI